MLIEVCASFLNTEKAFAGAACSLSDIKISSMNAKFINKCSSSECFYMHGVAVLENSCAEPIGVQVQIIAYDKSGSPVATSEAWPASTRNIPPGRYTFSLDHYLDYEPSITHFDLKPIEVNQWR
jgi:hypothetical protein